MRKTISRIVNCYRYDFIPTVLDRSVVDEWAKSNDRDSFLTARRMIKEEGLLCGGTVPIYRIFHAIYSLNCNASTGGSSGSAMAAAIEKAKTLKQGQKCVVVLPDSIRNYMTKFLSDEWLADRRIIKAEEKEKKWFVRIETKGNLRKLSFRSPPKVAR